MNFLIQTINGEIKHDFSFTLLESIEYNNWYNNNENIKYQFTNDIVNRTNSLIPHKTNIIPIGSVEFVLKFLEQFHNKKPLPKNVPVELFSFANRHIFNGTKKDLKGHGKSFVKSNDNIKGFTDIVNDDYVLPEGNYQISELINIDSEYRCFVHKDKLVGLQNYSGDFTLFPNIEIINRMINNYKNSPIAYTLDVGINDTGTFIIEIHDFFSCGLYGFSDLKILPYMFSQWYFNFIKKIN